MRTIPRRLFGALACSVMMSVVSSASAYVPTLTSGGCNPVHWAKSCVFVTADPAGTPDMPFADVDRIVRQALGAWNTPNQGATFLNLDYVASSTPQETIVDGWQVIKFRSDRWCRPADGEDPEVCYDSSAVAVTTVSYVSDSSDPENDGRIVDADIELNSVQNLFFEAIPGQAFPATDRRRMDLWNTLSHELGHLQGLDHTCRTDGWAMPACARDGDGEQVVSCDIVDAQYATNPKLAEMFAATMYPKAEPGESTKRAPKSDDLAAIRVLYPIVDDPNICTMPGDDTPPTNGSSTTQTQAPVTAGCSFVPQRRESYRDWISALSILAPVLMAWRQMKHR